MTKVIQEILEDMNNLPCLRTPQKMTAKDDAVVVCHETHLDQAMRFYHDVGIRPFFYILHSPKANVTIRSDTNSRPISELPTDAPCHIYTAPQKSTGVFSALVRTLAQKGINSCTFEPESISQFYGIDPSSPRFPLDEECLAEICTYLHDENSYQTFLACIKAHMSLNPGYYPVAPYPQYEHPLVQASRGDVVCEAGAYKGGTTLRLVNLVGKLGQVHTFEPDEPSYAICEHVFSQYPNIVLNKQALWSSSGTLSFYAEEESYGGSHVVNNGNMRVSCISLDEYFGANRVDVIKLDVEGAEQEVLKGCAKIITKNSPKLLISIYHNRGKDLLNVPLYLMKMYPDYVWYIGHHSGWFYETMLYGRKAD